MLDWRVWAFVIAICAYDGYSRYATEQSGEGAKGLSKDQAGQLGTIKMDDDEAVEEYGLKQLAFHDHEPNRLHIQYCQS